MNPAQQPYNKVESDDLELYEDQRTWSTTPP